MTGSRDWMVDALCTQTDPEIFFPAKGASLRPARRVCARCWARVECLDYALAFDEFGVWAGTSRVERQKLKREQEAA